MEPTFKTYDEWAESVGIMKDTESREAWEYQQKRIIQLEKEIKRLRMPRSRDDSYC